METHCLHTCCCSMMQTPHAHRLMRCTNVTMLLDAVACVLIDATSHTACLSICMTYECDKSQFMHILSHMCSYNLDHLMHVCACMQRVLDTDLSSSPEASTVVKLQQVGITTHAGQTVSLLTAHICLKYVVQYVVTTCIVETCCVARVVLRRDDTFMFAHIHAHIHSLHCATCIKLWKSVVCFVPKILFGVQSATRCILFTICACTMHVWDSMTPLTMSAGTGKLTDSVQACTDASRDNECQIRAYGTHLDEATCALTIFQARINQMKKMAELL